MRIVFQYTLTDIRKFDNSFSLLKLPRWPLPEPYKEFVRGNGQIIPSNDNIVTARLGKTNISESFICKINKGIKVRRKVVLQGLHIKNSINNYFSDGGVLSKYEIIFETQERNTRYSYTKVITIIKNLLEQGVQIRNKDFKYSPYKFRNIHLGLISLHLLSTTEAKYFRPGIEKCIIKCTPQIFVTLNKQETFTYKTQRQLLITINEAENCSLYGWWQEYSNNAYKVWLLKNSGPYNNEIINTLTKGILRIHSEKECINNVIQSLIKGVLTPSPKSDESHFLQEFLNTKIRDIAMDYKNINKTGSNAIKIEKFIKEVYENFNPGEVTLLHDRMKQLKLRPQVESKIIQHIIHNATIIEKQNIEKQTIMDNSQSISFGDNTNFQGNISQANNSNNQNTDFKAIYEELNRLLERISKEKESFEKEVAMEHLEAAKKAAVKKDSDAITNNLKKAGQWTIDFATKIGVNLVSEILKHQI